MNISHVQGILSILYGATITITLCTYTLFETVLVAITYPDTYYDLLSLYCENFYFASPNTTDV